MANVQETVLVHSDLKRMYEMWTEFDHYPDFMPHVIEVRHTGETLMKWMMEFGGERHEWEVQVVQMDPERKIILQTTHTTAPIRYVVTFEVNLDGINLTLCMENAPGSDAEISARIRESLANFKAIAEQGPPTRWSMPS